MVVRSRPAPAPPDAPPDVRKAQDRVMRAGRKANRSPAKGGDRIRIGVVGLGYWGPNLVRNLAETQSFDIAYLCDVRTQALEAISGRYPGIPCTTRYEEIL